MHTHTPVHRHGNHLQGFFFFHQLHCVYTHTHTHTHISRVLQMESTSFMHLEVITVIVWTKTWELQWCWELLFCFAHLKCIYVGFERVQEEYAKDLWQAIPVNCSVKRIIYIYIYLLTCCSAGFLLHSTDDGRLYTQCFIACIQTDMTTHWQTHKHIHNAMICTSLHPQVTQFFWSSQEVLCCHLFHCHHHHHHRLHLLHHLDPLKNYHRQTFMTMTDFP